MIKFVSRHFGATCIPEYNSTPALRGIRTSAAGFREKSVNAPDFSQSKKTNAFKFVVLS